ncbi:MAG: PLP-dependent aminotransferase family protein [Ruthenibacterium lactatiformans]
MESFTLGLMRGEGAPLYRQLYRHIVEEIASGGLAAGEKLPSKRRLAADLRVSVSTVETAYQMLVAEGYIAARAKSGFTVCRIEKLDAPVRPAPAAPPEPPAKRWAYDFGTGSVDTALFPFKTWARIQRETVTAHPELLNHGSRQGDASLRAAIAKYLHAYRGVVCAEQIVVGAGIDIWWACWPAVLRQHLAVENGLSHGAGAANNGVRTVFVPVDGDGMTLDALQAGGAQLAYGTPSHQFPTGATRPIARRTELLRWAGAAPGRYVVEDDYDSEFRYDTRPIPSLQGLDQAGRVIYVSTFSKSMAPSMRIGYMVLPVPVLEMYRAEYGVYSSTVSRFEQQTLCRFMDEGHFARHLNRLRGACRARRDALLEALYAAFGRDGVAVRGSHTGLHLLAAVHNGMTERELVEAAARAGVHVNGLSAYYMEHPEDCPPATVVLGYSDMDERALRAAVDALRCAWGARPSE